MKNTLNNFDYADLSNGEIIAILRFALTAQGVAEGLVTVDATFFDEIITRMTSLCEVLDDATTTIGELTNELDGLESAEDIDDANDHVSALNKKEQAVAEELNCFRRFDADERRRLLVIANEERLRNSCPF
jgi:hypothetical protein